MKCCDSQTHVAFVPITFLISSKIQTQLRLHSFQTPNGLDEMAKHVSVVEVQTTKITRSRKDLNEDT